MNIAKALDAAIREAALTNEQVAVRMGVAANTVWKWRSGNSSPRAELYEKLRAEVPGFADKIASQIAVADAQKGAA